MTSPQAPALPRPQASLVYGRLCTLMNAVLTVHRQRLRRRLHLVLVVMQGLLRCLFIPHHDPTGRSDPQLSSPPIWLGDTINHRQQQPLTVVEAGKFARLLGALCDPTVSSVSGKNHHDDDTHQRFMAPATDSARRLAGQHLVYLLIDYSQCLLYGNMPTADMKKVVVQSGLYPLMDAAGLQVLKMVIAAMDHSCREVFRGLFRDWDRDVCQRL